MRRLRHRSAAFTLIEMITVIAIITILTALLIMGVSKMARTAKTNATRADLENVQSLFDEMNAHGGMNTAPVNWLWRNVTYSSPGAPTITASAATVGPPPVPAVNFWKVPNIVYFAAGVPTLDAMDACGSIADLDGTGTSVLRNGSRAVLNTQLAMRILLSYPGNKAAIAKLPADRLFIPNWGTGSFFSGGADGVTGTGGDDATQVAYATNNCVKYQGSTFRCIVANQASSTTIPPAPGVGGALTNNTYWQQDTDPTPLILDAWGNPLIFVPATGLINVYTGTKGGSDSTITLLNATPSVNVSVVVPAPYARTLPPIQSPDNRPFFVSAGPDGDLTTGDDNIYSFSK